MVSGAHAGSPVVVQRDDDEHEALRMKRGPADEEHQHHGHCKAKKGTLSAAAASVVNGGISLQ